MGLLVGFSFSFPAVTVSSDTFHSIGMVVDLPPGADANHNATMSVRYRKIGDAWSTGMDLIRNDYTWFFGAETGDPANGFAGSVMLLTPGTTYDVELTYTDPDNSPPTGITSFQATTRAIPAKPTPTNTYYVEPGHGGTNSGTSDNPWTSINAAQGSLVAGDLVLLRNGTYAAAVITAAGAEDDWIVYEPDTGHSPVLYTVSIKVDHIWFDGLTSTGDATSEDEGGNFQVVSSYFVPFPGFDVNDIIISNCTVTRFVNGILHPYTGSRWIVSDNDLTGVKGVGAGDGPNDSSSTGRGVNIAGTTTDLGANHIIAWNNITQYADGINNVGDSDVYGNKVWDCADDACSSDGSFSNVRLWGCMLQDVAGSCLSFQPQKLGPWYFMWNQIGDAGLGNLKWRVQDRVVFIHNTFIGGNNRGQYWMKCVVKNNLFLGVSTGRLIDGSDVSSEQPTNYSAPQWTSDWNTDWDYNGHDHTDSTPWDYSWEDQARFSNTIATWLANDGDPLGVEANGVELDKDAIYATFVNDPGTLLQLDSGANDAVNAGIETANVADFYSSTAPDLGCDDRDNGPIVIGPRAGADLNGKTEHWTKH